jgi:glycyl-tRNA synthetase beta chain
VAVALADKLDTIALFFSVGLPPTGSKDPFALRRATLGVIALIEQNGLRLSIRDAVSMAVASAQGIPEIGWKIGEAGVALAIGALPFRSLDHSVVELLGNHFYAGAVANFFAERLKIQQREAGIRHDLIDAVFALGSENDLVRLLARVRALQAFVTTDDGTNLLAGYKRAANILKKEGVDGDQSWTAPTYTPEPAEAELIGALDAAEPKAAAAVKAEDFEAAMAALASLRAPIDRFFDDVTVNDADPAKRAVRLALLARVRAAVHTVADFSRIEG